jgi:hypothetical protein
MVFAVDLELFVVGVCVDPIHQHRERLVHVFVLEWQTEVVSDKLTDPEPGGLVDELGFADRPLLRSNDGNDEQRNGQANGNA